MTYVWVVTIGEAPDVYVKAENIWSAIEHARLVVVPGKMLQTVEAARLGLLREASDA